MYQERYFFPFALLLRMRDINLTFKSSKLQAKCFMRLFCALHYPHPALLILLLVLRGLPFPSPHLHICAPSSLVVSFGTVFMPCVLVKLSCAVSAFLMLRLICPLLRWKLEARTMSLFILMPRQSARYILNFKWLPLFGNHPGTP